MAKVYFIAGTDTEVGKTYVTCQLLEYYKAQGLTTVAIKPVAAGVISQAEPVNADVLKLQQAMTVSLPVEDINPVLLTAPLSPNIAARRQGMTLTVEEIALSCKPALQTQADIILVEGCGGWLCPLNSTETMADLVKRLNLEVILVVGLRLGCLNHSLLTAEVMKSSGCRLSGWIANCIDPGMQAVNENINTLKSRLQLPLITTLNYGARLALSTLTAPADTSIA